MILQIELSIKRKASSLMIRAGRLTVHPAVPPQMPVLSLWYTCTPFFNFLYSYYYNTYKAC